MFGTGFVCHSPRNSCTNGVIAMFSTLCYTPTIEITHQSFLGSFALTCMFKYKMFWYACMNAF